MHGDTALLHIEQGAFIELAYRSAMTALHIIGINLQLGLGIHMRFASGAKITVRLLGTRMLRTRAYQYQTCKSTDRLVVEHILKEFVTGTVRHCMVYGGIVVHMLLFIGIGAMIDFGPLLEKPWLMLFGAAAQFGIFFTLFLAGFFFDLKDAASIAVIGAADGPTAIFVANVLHSQYLGAIMVAAYSYMALVPIVQPPVIKLLTTQKERRIRMPYQKGSVSQLTKILFPIVVTIIAGLVAPASVALVGFLMFGNLLRECGVLNTLSETAQNVLANLITIVLGLTVAGQMTADKFVRPDTLLILALGLVAFVFDTAGGVLFAKLANLFLPESKKLNPMIGAAGISAFPMSGRVVNKLGLEEDNQNFLLMYSISVNVSGQIASVIAGGLLLTLLS